MRLVLLARLIVPLIALLESGCVTESWRGDTSFTAEERTAIEEGNEWLAAHTDQPARIIVWDLSPDEDAPRYSIRDARLADPEFAKRSSAHRIRFDRAQFDAYPPEVRLRFYRLAAAHEFGHELGMKHHAGSGVMSPVLDVKGIWTMQDIVECRRVGACD